MLYPTFDFIVSCFSIVLHRIAKSVQSYLETIEIGVEDISALDVRHQTHR